MKTKQKIGIQNRLLIYGAGLGILICGIGIEIAILKNEIQNAERKIQFDNYIAETTNLFQNFDFQILNWESAEEITLENGPENSNPSPFFPLSDQDRQIVYYIVAGEAGNEPIEGKMLVAQCLLHAMTKDQITASEVRKKYLYSGWREDLESTAPKAWAEVCEAVSRVFDDGEFVSDKPILFFYAPKYAKGRWHETLNHDQELGGHRFFYLDDDETADWFLELRK